MGWLAVIRKRVFPPHFIQCEEFQAMTRMIFKQNSGQNLPLNWAPGRGRGAPRRRGGRPARGGRLRHADHRGRAAGAADDGHRRAGRAPHQAGRRAERETDDDGQWGIECKGEEEAVRKLLGIFEPIIFIRYVIICNEMND